MRWNQFGNDPPRAMALGDVLLGAAHAAALVNDAKLAVARGQVVKAMGLTELPPEVEAHLARFEPRAFDLGAACAQLRLDGARERMSLIKAVSLVINGDGQVHAEERGFALRVATYLGVAWNDVLDLIGMPHRPTTGPRPRPSPRQ